MRTAKLYHPVARQIIAMPEDVFNEAVRTVAKGLSIRDNKELMDKLRQLHKQAYSHIPFISFTQWVQYVIEKYLAKEIEAEYEPVGKYYRLMCAVLVYTEKVTNRTPECFMEARAWTIVPESIVASDDKLQQVISALEIEVAPLIFYMGSLYNAFFKLKKGEKSISAISKKCREFGSEEVKVRATVQSDIIRSREDFAKIETIVFGYEIVDITDDLNELTVSECNCARSPKVCRAIAFYRYDEDTWRNCYWKYDETAISSIEEQLLRTSTIRKFEYDGWTGIRAFKKFCRDKLIDIITELAEDNTDKAFVSYLKVAD